MEVITMKKTFDELRDELADKLGKEFSEFKAKLLESDPKTILEDAYKYTVCIDIVLAVEGSCEYDFSKDEIKTLLESDNALERIYACWQDTEASYSDEIRETIRSTAERITEEKSRKERTRSGGEAR